MKHPLKRALRAVALALMLAATPACTTTKIENPVAVAQTADQKAYALLATYAAVLETATVLVRDPVLPLEAKRALVRAEAVATPAASALRTAYVAYLRARADYAAKTTPTAEASATIALAASRLDDAIGAATPRVAAMATLTGEVREPGELTK